MAEKLDKTSRVGIFGKILLVLLASAGVLALLVLLGLAIFGFENLERIEAEKKNNVCISKIILSNAVLSDHVAFFPFNVDGGPHKNVHLIIEVIDSFKKKYPKYANATWQIEYADDKTYGIWIFY